MKRFNQLPKPAQQILIGGSAGWLTGFSLAKFGRGAGFSIGATIFILQLGQQYGYININWKRVNSDLNKAKQEVKKQADVHIPEIADKVEGVLMQNVVMASSFAGGFFLGASSA